MKEEGKNITTGEDFLVFQSEARKWLSRFGLAGWQVFFKHEDDDSQDGTLATCGASSNDKFAVISLMKDWGKEEVTNEEIAKTAFHEVMELLLWDLASLAEGMYSKAVVASEVHRIIRTFENTLCLVKE